MAELNDKLAKMLSGLDDSVTKVKIQKMLDMLKDGKADEMIKKLEKTDKAKIQEMMNKFDKKKLESLGLNLKEIQNQVDSGTINDLQSKVGNIDPALAKKMNEFLK